MKNNLIHKVSIKEKIGYALGDGAANIAWRGVSTFLLFFYTDVFGITPATAGLLLLIARSSDGFSDVLMGIVGIEQIPNTENSVHGFCGQHFRWQLSCPYYLQVQI